MIVLKNTEIGRTWLEYLDVVRKGVEGVPDDREPIVEQEPISYTLKNFDDKFGIIERNQSSDVIEQYTKKMFSLELIPELNSTYGDRFFDNGGVNQVELAIEKLKANQWAKSCFIPLVIPNDPGPRIPCLSAVQVAIRKSAVELHCTFRSQNAFNSYGNMLGLRAIQDMISEKLGFDRGDIHCTVNFPHIYNSNLTAVSKILAAESEYID